MSVGIPVAEEVIVGSMYQALLQSTSISQLTHRLSILTRNVSSMTDFVTAQLQYTAFQASSHNIKLGSIMDAQASDLVSLSMIIVLKFCSTNCSILCPFLQEMLSKRLVEQEYVCESRVTACEHQLRDTSRSLCELQDAYNEKVRKCQAWEKV